MYAETVEEEQTLVALKKKLITEHGLTKEGWTSLNEIDDDWWND